MKKILFILISILMITTGCNKDELEGSKELYSFTGEFFGLVDQKGRKLEDLKINYTVTLHDFSPSGKVFESYNSEYRKDSKEKHIHITDSTKIYNASKTKEISPTSIKIGSQIKFTVSIVNEHILEAVEIVILE